MESLRQFTSLEPLFAGGAVVFHMIPVLLHIYLQSGRGETVDGGRSRIPE